MDTDLRASLVAAGAAAALSALIGLIAGVGFFVLFLRALGCGIGLGAVVFGGLFLARRSLPGLFSTSSAEAVRADDEGLGAKVDIVLPAEGASAEAYGPAEGAWAPAADRPAVAGATEVSAADREGFSPSEAASLLEPEEAEPVGAALPSGHSAGKERHATGSFDDLDVLPDLDGFSDAFAASEFMAGGVGGGAGGGVSGGLKPESSSAARAGPATTVASGSRGGQEGFDPSSLAKAVSTIMKRDQKG